MLGSTLKKYLVYLVLFASFGLYGYCSAKQIRAQKLENERLSNNLKNVNMEVEVTKAKNGDLVYSVNALTVKSDELKYLNKKLYGDINNMNLKLKNVQSITDIRYQYETCYDTIFTSSSLTKFKHGLDLSDKYTTVTGNINLPLELFSSDSLVANSIKARPYISEFKFNLKDSLKVVPEWQYKRRWIFWKRVVGVTVHVKSESPNFKLDQIQTYQIKN